GLELYDEAANKENWIAHGEVDEEILNNLDNVNYWYRKSAESNDKTALYKLGEFYELGKGVKLSERRAFEFYKKSATQGCIDAQYKLGHIYSNGVEIDINREKAFDQYNIAAEGGNVDAQCGLAFLYENGE